MSTIGFWKTGWRFLTLGSLLTVQGCLFGCAFSGSTALPEPSEVKIKTPSGYEFYTNSKVKTAFKIKDGEKEIEFKMTSKPDDVIDAQANLATALAPLAAIETDRQKVWVDGVKAMFKMALDRIPVPGTGADGAPPVP